MAPTVLVRLALVGALTLPFAGFAQEPEADAGVEAPAAISVEELSKRVDELSRQLNDVRQSSASEKGGSSGFLLAGFAAAGLSRDFSANTTSFGADFSPVLLWRPMDKVFVEAELMVHLDEGSASIELEYAQLAYLASDYFTVGAGLFLNPINVFGERLHPSWINRLPDAPLPFGHHGGLVSMTELGVQVRGAVPVGRGSIAYAVFVSNGPRLNTGEDEPDEAGVLHSDNFNAVNPFKTVGGRLAYRPHHGVELGVGGEYGRVGPANTAYSNIAAVTVTADLSLGRSFDALKGAVDFHVQYVWTHVDEAEYQGRTWDNTRSGGYAQLSYRAVMAESSVLSSLEPVVRVDAVWAPLNAPMGMSMVRITGGLDYWLAPVAVLKLAFEDTPSMQTTALLAQFGVGF